MILKNQLYTIEGTTKTGDSTIVSIKLNPDCFIYKAHFPNNPITPGVCIVQTACELLGEILGKNLEITEAKDIKFTNILSPTQNEHVDFVFENIVADGESIKAKADVKDGDEVFTSIVFTCAPY